MEEKLKGSLGRVKIARKLFGYSVYLLKADGKWHSFGVTLTKEQALTLMARAPLYSRTDVRKYILENHKRR